MGVCLSQNKIQNILKPCNSLTTVVKQGWLAIFKVEVRDWSLIPGRGGATKREGGAREVLPLRKGGGGKSFSFAEGGGTKSFRVVFTQ